MRKKLLAVLLAAAMLFSLAACDAAPTLYDVTLAEDGKLAVTEATAFDTDSPTPHEDKVLTLTEVQTYLQYSFSSSKPLYFDLCILLETAAEELGLQHLRRSPGGMYYSVFDTNRGGRLYLFFINAAEVPWYRDKLMIEDGEAPFFVIHPSFYVEDVYSYKDFQSLKEGDPLEKVYELLPWMETLRLDTIPVLLEDGALYIEVVRTDPPVLGDIEYREDFVYKIYETNVAPDGYSEAECDLVNDYRVWDFDLMQGGALNE